MSRAIIGGKHFMFDNQYCIQTTLSYDTPPKKLFQPLIKAGVHYVPLCYGMVWTTFDEAERKIKDHHKRMEKLG